MMVSLNEPKKSYTVSASAGSGKTYALISRLFRLCMAGNQLEKSLVLTFSRKACQDLVTQIHQLLFLAASSNTETVADILQRCGITPTAASIKRARLLYYRVTAMPFGLRIKTFHAFFQELLQTVPNNFRFALEGDLLDDASLLHARGIEELLQLDSKHNDAKPIIELFLKTGSIHQVKKLLHQYLNYRHLISTGSLDTDDSLSACWQQAGVMVGKHVDAIARMEHVFEYGTIECEAWALLTSHRDMRYIQYKLYSRIQNLLVDEFQDTSPIQWQCIKILLGGIMEETDESLDRSFFMVGDSKQMIYSFRGALPSLQKYAYKKLGKRYHAQSAALTTTRRCPSAILEVLNTCFQTKTSVTSNFFYTKHQSHDAGKKGRIELFDLASGATAASQEADMVARRIKTLVNSSLGLDEEAISYQDIVILRKNRNRSKEIEAALKQHDIPYNSDHARNGFDNQAVVALIALIKYMVRNCTVSLFEVLASPLVNIPIAQRKSYLQTATTTLDRLTEHAVTQGFDALEETLSILRELQTIKYRIPPHDFLSRALSAFQFDPYRFEDPEETYYSVAALIEQTLQVRQGRYPNLAGLLDYLEHQMQASQLPIQQPTGLSDAVRLLTIHAAKGLEAPIVFFIDCVAKASREKYQIITNDNDIEKPIFSLNSSNSTNSTNSTALAMQQKTELANLMYVATTRASKMLAISGHQKTIKVTDGSRWYNLIKESFPEAAQRDEGFIWHGDALTRKPKTARPKQDKKTIFKPTKNISKIISNKAGDKTGESFTTTSKQNSYRGTVIHRLMELLTPPLNKTTLPQDALKKKCMAWALDDDTFKEYSDQARAILQNPEFRWIFYEFDEAMSELALASFDLGGRVVVDRVVRHKNTITVIDYKTGKMRKGYSEQLQRYRHYLERLYPQTTIACGILLLDERRYTPIEFSK